MHHSHYATRVVMAGLPAGNRPPWLYYEHIRTCCLMHHQPHYSGDTRTQTHTQTLAQTPSGRWLWGSFLFLIEKCEQAYCLWSTVCVTDLVSQGDCSTREDAVMLGVGLCNSGYMHHGQFECHTHTNSCMKKVVGQFAEQRLMVIDELFFFKLIIIFKSFRNCLLNITFIN